MPDIIIHGHFYQPPREEPWLELVQRELSAAPDHDWNERITRECYAPLARGRILDEQGRLVRVINAYEWLSFNIGPTLFRWFDHHAPEVGAAIVAGDRASVARTGFGNALAMPFHHAIMPLLSRRDKVTEVRWGIRDFQARFGRAPEGMWLPETAVDEETLEVLSDERIRFTVLAPQQVEGWPPFGRPGRWRTGAGREIALFVYDGPAAHNVAFGDALDDASRWEANLTNVPVATDGGPTVVSIATDGETFGHHHRFGDLALAAMIDRVSRRADAALTNFATVLKASPPQYDLKIVS
ncbi:MAG: glycoside hydrolase, partial [Gemmatimonadota bacterium]